jgi:hypothetical protein
MQRLGLAVALVLAGCGGEHESASEPESASPTRTRGGRLGAAEVARSGAVSAGGGAPAAAARAGTRMTTRGRERADDTVPAIPYSTPPPAEGAPASSADPEAPARRDLEEELRGAYHLPHDCFTFARVSEMGESITLRVTVTVMPSGRVTEGSVRGSGLTDAETECLERAALDVRLRAPVDGAPRTVSASIEFAIETRPAEE